MYVCSAFRLIFKRSAEVSANSKPRAGRLGHLGLNDKLTSLFSVCNAYTYTYIRLKPCSILICCYPSAVGGNPAE